MPWRRAGWGFLTSDRRRDVRKPCSAQTRRRTAARASAKVGRGSRYQAAVQTAERARWSRQYREQGDDREQREQAGRGARDGVVRPLTSVPDPEVVAHLPGRCGASRWHPPAGAGRSGTTCRGWRGGSVQGRACGSRRPRGSRRRAPGGSAPPAGRRGATRRWRGRPRPRVPARRTTRARPPAPSARPRPPAPPGGSAVARPRCAGARPVPGRRGGAGSYRAAEGRAPAAARAPGRARESDRAAPPVGDDARPCRSRRASGRAPRAGRAGARSPFSGAPAASGCALIEVPSRNARPSSTPPACAASSSRCHAPSLDQRMNSCAPAATGRARPARPVAAGRCVPPDGRPHRPPQVTRGRLAPRPARLDQLQRRPPLVRQRQPSTEPRARASRWEQQLKP